MTAWSPCADCAALRGPCSKNDFVPGETKPCERVREPHKGLCGFGGIRTTAVAGQAPRAFPAPSGHGDAADGAGPRKFRAGGRFVGRGAELRGGRVWASLKRSTVQPAWRLLVELAACVLGSKGTCGSTEEAGMDRRPQEAPGDDTDRQEVRDRGSKPAHQQQADAKAPQRI
jgi:hypothetical protein